MKVDREQADQVYGNLRAGGPLLPPLDERLAAFVACFAAMVDEDEPDDNQPAWVREHNRRRR